MVSEPRAAVRERQREAAQWAEAFNAPAMVQGGHNPLLTGPLRKALGVIVLTAHIRDYLAEFDPMALRQIQEALKS